MARALLALLLALPVSSGFQFDRLDPEVGELVTVRFDGYAGSDNNTIIDFKVSTDVDDDDAVVETKVTEPSITFTTDGDANVDFVTNTWHYITLSLLGGAAGQEFITGQGFSVTADSCGFEKEAVTYMGLDTVKVFPLESYTVTSHAVSISLGDEESGDVFAVKIETDTVYGTPIFTTIGGESTCPGETATTRRAEEVTIFDIIPHCQRGAGARASPAAVALHGTRAGTASRSRRASPPVRISCQATRSTSGSSCRTRWKSTK